jgi:hypothetical protein
LLRQALGLVMPIPPLLRVAPEFMTEGGVGAPHSLRHFSRRAVPCLLMVYKQYRSP